MKNLTYVAVLVLLASCGGVSNESQKLQPIEEKESVEQKVDARKLTVAKDLFRELPTPAETAKLIKDSKVKYNGTLLSDIDKAAGYHSTQAMAVNMGIYGTDLNYAGIYKQKQQFMELFAACKQLAENLHIEDAFTEKLIEDIEANEKNTSAILQLITDAYWTANSSLKEEGRAAVSTMIVSSGWLEGLYLSLVLYNESKNEALLEKISSQFATLENVFNLFGAEEEDPAARDMREDFRAINDVYKKITSNDNNVLTEENIAELTTITTNLRAKYVALN